MAILVRVDNRLRIKISDLPPWVVDRLKDAFTHQNPEYHKLKSMGYWTGNVPRFYETWEIDGDEVSLPRGGTKRLRSLLDEASVAFRYDVRVSDGTPYDYRPHRFKDGNQLADFQVEAVETFIKRQNCVVRSPTGCVSGEAKIGLNRCGKGYREELKWVVRMFHGESRSGRRWDSSKTYVRAPFADGTVRLAELIDAKSSGVQEVLRVTLESGRYLDVTPDHRFLIHGNRWMEASNLQIGERTLIDGGMGVGVGNKPWYQLKVCRRHPYAGRRGVDPNKGGFTVPLHRLIYEAHLNEMGLDEFLLAVDAGISWLRFLDPKLFVVHHKDRCPRNNSLENLELLTKAQHAERHLDDSLANISSYLRIDPVSSIQRVGSTETYDLQIDKADAFMANEIAVHNSGKTSMAIAGISKVGRSALVMVWTAALMKQWVDRLVDELQIPRSDIGILGGGKNKIRPITVAMQQTVHSIFQKGGEEAERLRTCFGMVVCDECVEGSTKVLMSDGSQKPIRDVRVGDCLGLGGTVLRIMDRDYEGELTSIGEGSFTSEHPVASGNRWVPASMVCDNDVLWEAFPHDLSTMWEGSSFQQSSGNLSQPRVLQDIRFGEWGMCTLWKNSSKATSILPRVQRLWDYQALELGTDKRNERICQKVCGETPGVQPSRGFGQTQRILEGSHNKGSLLEIDFRSTEAKVSKRIGGREKQDPDVGVDISWKDCSVWRPEIRKWGLENTERVRDGEKTIPIWLSVWGSCEDRDEPSNPLQDRFGKRTIPGGDRTGWVKSQQKADRIRSTEDLLPTVVGVVGDSEKGTCGLREVRARVSRSFAKCRVYNLETTNGVYVAGGILVHNCQRFAAKTFISAIDPFCSRYRLGFSADETRRDQKEYLIYDEFGEVVVDIDRNDLIDRSFILDVDVRVVPTKFRADWYNEEFLPDGRTNRNHRDFGMLLDAMCTDTDRNELVQRVIGWAAKDGGVMVFSHRVEHCQLLDRLCIRDGIQSGLMLGSQQWSHAFDATKQGLVGGKIRVGIGTFQAIGQAIDVPAVSRGVMSTPVNNNRQMFGQVRGRMCRANRAGSRSAELYYLWDRNVFGTKPIRNLMSWNNRVLVLDEDRWVEAKAFLAKERKMASLFG